MNAAELTVELRTLSERVENLRRDQQADATELKRLDAAVQTLQTELALLRQRVDDHLKRVETRDTRLWAVFVVLVGAVLSLASGLIVALARK